MERLARWAWLLVALPILALFGPALFSDTSLALRDAGHFYHPLFAWCAAEWNAGRIPLWNPEENCGLPVLADATASVFYPGKLLFALPLDFALRYKLYVLGHVVLAAWTAYWLARSWRRSQPAAAIAALAYACGGSVVFQYCNVVFLVSAAWLPLAALLVDRLLVHRSWRAALGLGGLLALLILGGDPQAAIHSLFLAVLYAAVLFPGFRSGKKLAASNLGQQLLLLSAAAVVAVFLAAIQVFPSVEATQHSQRATFNRPRSLFEAVAVDRAVTPDEDEGRESRWKRLVQGVVLAPEPGSHHELVYEFSVGPWRLVEYLWPNVAGRMFPTNRRWMAFIPSEGQVWTPTLYMGLLPLLLALGALRLWGGEARERWLSWAALLFTLGSFGFYGGGWLLTELGWFRGNQEQPGIAPGLFGVYWFLVTLVPTYVFYRYPAKLLPFVALAVSQLAARELDRLNEGKSTFLPRLLRWLAVSSALAAAAFWFAGPRILARFVSTDSLTGPFDPLGARHDVVMAFAQTAVVAALLGLVLWGIRTAGRRRGVWQLAAVGLTAIELAFANAWLVATAPAELWRREPAAARVVHAASAHRVADTVSGLPLRVFRGNLATWRPASFQRSGATDRLARIVAWEHDTLFPKHQSRQGIGLVESITSLPDANYQALLEVAKQHGPVQVDQVPLPQPTLLRLLGTEFLVLPAHDAPAFAARLPTVADLWPEDTAAWQMQRTLPRAWMVHNVVELPPLSASASTRQRQRRAYEVLFPHNEPRDFFTQAVIESAIPAPQSRTDSRAEVPAESCEIVRYEPQFVALQAELARPGLLVLSDAWYPGWRATVTTSQGTQVVPIVRTNRVLRGVWLPAGSSRVEFRFVPRSFYWGAAISAISILILGILIARTWDPRKMSGRWWPMKVSGLSGLGIRLMGMDVVVVMGMFGLKEPDSPGERDS